MAPIYAACISVSQGSGQPKVSAVMVVHDEDRRTNVTVEWDLPGAVNADGNPSEWLYSVLNRLVMGYDDHTVTAASVAGVEDMKEGLNG
jgi:hypothetical protein